MLMNRVLEAVCNVTSNVTLLIISGGSLLFYWLTCFEPYPLLLSFAVGIAFLIFNCFELCFECFRITQTKQYSFWSRIEAVRIFLMCGLVAAATYSFVSVDYHEASVDNCANRITWLQARVNRQGFTANFQDAVNSATVSEWIWLLSMELRISGALCLFVLVLEGVVFTLLYGKRCTPPETADGEEDLALAELRQHRKADLIREKTARGNIKYMRSPSALRDPDKLLSLQQEEQDHPTLRLHVVSPTSDTSTTNEGNNEKYLRVSADDTVGQVKEKINADIYTFCRRTQQDYLLILKGVTLENPRTVRSYYPEILDNVIDVLIDGSTAETTDGDTADETVYQTPSKLMTDSQPHSSSSPITESPESQQTETSERKLQQEALVRQFAQLRQHQSERDLLNLKKDVVSRSRSVTPSQHSGGSRAQSPQHPQQRAQSPRQNLNLQIKHSSTPLLGEMDMDSSLPLSTPLTFSRAQRSSGSLSYLPNTPFMDGDSPYDGTTPTPSPHPTRSTPSPFTGPPRASRSSSPFPFPPVGPPHSQSQTQDLSQYTPEHQHHSRSHLPRWSNGSSATAEVSMTHPPVYHSSYVQAPPPPPPPPASHLPPPYHYPSHSSVHVPRGWSGS